MILNDSTSSHHCRCILSNTSWSDSEIWDLDVLQQPTVAVSLFCARAPSPVELMGGMAIRISAIGQRYVALRLFWKDGCRRPDLPVCINHADVASGFCYCAYSKCQKIKKCIFIFALQVWVVVVVARICLRQQLFNQTLLCENKLPKAKHQIWPPGALFPKSNHQRGGHI